MRDRNFSFAFAISESISLGVDPLPAASVVYERLARRQYLPTAIHSFSSVRFNFWLLSHQAQVAGLGLAIASAL
jgi:hypothetical protein